MKNPNSLHTHSQWVQTLTTGGQTDCLFRISPSVAMRLIPEELVALRRDLRHNRKRQAETLDEASRIARRRREAPELTDLRRRLKRLKEQAQRMQADITQLVRGMRSLIEQGRFLPPAKLPERKERESSGDWSLPRGTWRAA